MKDFARDILENYTYSYAEVDVEKLAKQLEKARKETSTDVIDEFMKKITCRLSYDRDSELYGKTKIVLMFNKIVAEMRQEVEK